MHRGWTSTTFGDAGPEVGSLGSQHVSGSVGSCCAKAQSQSLELSFIVWSEILLLLLETASLT